MSQPTKPTKNLENIPPSRPLQTFTPATHPENVHSHTFHELHGNKGFNVGNLESPQPS